MQTQRLAGRQRHQQRRRVGAEYNAHASIHRLGFQRFTLAETLILGILGFLILGLPPAVRASFCTRVSALNGSGTSELHLIHPGVRVGRGDGGGHGGARQRQRLGCSLGGALKLSIAL